MPGFGGIAVGVLIGPALWLIIWLMLPPGPFDMDFHGEKGTFIPLLSMYVDIAKFIMGLASGTIALLVGSAIVHSNGGIGPLLVTFVSPLYLLALSLIWGVLFMPFLALDYEGYRDNEKPYTRFKYARNQAFGFSSLACFALGYCWLILIVARSH